jgi:hypothetical protein
MLLPSTAVCLLMPSLALGQAANPAPPQARAGNPMMSGETESALGHKATGRGAMFGELNKAPDITGSGPYPATYANAADGSEYVVYQPKDLNQVKGKLGIYIWGNGGCGGDAASARFHLTEIASRGYVAIAPGLIQSGPKAPAQQKPGVRATAEDMVAALDWILAENKRAASPFFGKVDPNRVAFSGHSCGGLIAMKAAMDPRARVLVLENSGIIRPMPGSEAFTAIKEMNQLKKADLNTLHTPVLYILGGPQDMAEPNGLDDFKHFEKGTVFVADHPGAGHGGLFGEPNGEATKLELDWLDWHLNGDRVAARTFVGADCTLCRDFRWNVYRKGIE